MRRGYGLRILKKDLHHGLISVTLEDVDDLWILYNIVEPGDLATSKATREIKAYLGRPSSKRVVMTLTVEVTKVEFDTSLNRLRIQGVIRECPEEYGIKGSYHTLAVASGSSVTIYKKIWQRHHLYRLESVVKSKKPVIMVALDAESACIAIVRSFKVEVKAEINPCLPGKMDSEARSLAEKKFLKELGNTLLRITKSSSTTPNAILITGPGFLKEHFKNLLDDEFPEIASNVLGVKGGSYGGVSGVFEALRSGVLEALVRDSRVAEEISTVENLLARIGSNGGDVSYGLDQVADDAALGAVEKLLVTVDLLKSPNIRGRVEKIIWEVERKRGKVMIISTEHEGGHKLESLGGIATLLRYKRHGW